MSNATPVLKYTTAYTLWRLQPLKGIYVPRGVCEDHCCCVLKKGFCCCSAQVAAADPNARYALGSVLNHVLLHQTIIGEEALLQLAKIGETPDLVVSTWRRVTLLRRNSCVAGMGLTLQVQQLSVPQSY
jgi:hypothetical protein